MNEKRITNMVNVPLGLRSVLWFIASLSVGYSLGEESGHRVIGSTIGALVGLLKLCRANRKDDVSAFNEGGLYCRSSLIIISFVFLWALCGYIGGSPSGNITKGYYSAFIALNEGVLLGYTLSVFIRRSPQAIWGIALGSLVGPLILMNTGAFYQSLANPQQLARCIILGTFYGSLVGSTMPDASPKILGALGGASVGVFIGYLIALVSDWKAGIIAICVGTIGGSAVGGVWGIGGRIGGREPKK